MNSSLWGFTVFIFELFAKVFHIVFIFVGVLPNLRTLHPIKNIITTYVMLLKTILFITFVFSSLYYLQIERLRVDLGSLVK